MKKMIVATVVLLVSVLGGKAFATDDGKISREAKEATPSRWLREVGVPSSDVTVPSRHCFGQRRDKGTGYGDPRRNDGMFYRPMRDGFGKAR